ncbi:MAG: DUF4835 family protein [Prevotellaceae bacterium]|jgi:hypothetical protein|nr:DUF4835 family protein [Prevotellaceae bacterium]
MRRILTAILLFSFILTSAQELKCNVNINTSQVNSSTNKQIFETLKKSIDEFMNNRKWTDMTFAESERIECTVNIIVKTFADNVFGCELLVQSRRPVWNSGYSSPLLNFRDPAVNFTYYEFDPLEINTTYDNNLTAILAYYAYIIIGYDLDSFQKLGGTQAFYIAEQIVNLSQNRSAPDGDGWKAFDKNGKRYELINNLLDSRFTKFREYFYDYHRFGLDNMTSNTGNARAKIAEGLPVVRELNRLQPQSQAIVSFLDAKGDELVNVFAKKGTEKERENVYKILTDVNPTNASRYEAIKN